MTDKEIKKAKKDTAIELVDFYTQIIFEGGASVSKPIAKKVAITSVNGLINQLNRLNIDFDMRDLAYMAGLVNYWEDIIEEIEKL